MSPEVAYENGGGKASPPPPLPIRVCAWCPESDEVSKLFKAAGLPVTHTVCRSCLRECFPEIYYPVERQKSCY